MVQASSILDRVLVLEMVRVTEAAAIAASKLVGRGDEKAADAAAVEAMRLAFNDLYMDGTVVIGEGERDEAPMLYIGEKVGAGGPKIDIALDPLEGTTLCAKDMPGSIAVMAMARSGSLLNAPDVYMEKIAIGPGYPQGVVDRDAVVRLGDLERAVVERLDACRGQAAHRALHVVGPVVQAAHEVLAVLVRAGLQHLGVVIREKYLRRDKRAFEFADAMHFKIADAGGLHDSSGPRGCQSGNVAHLV